MLSIWCIDCNSGRRIGRIPDIGVSTVPWWLCAPVSCVGRVSSSPTEVTTDSPLRLAARLPPLLDGQEERQGSSDPVDISHRQYP